MSTRSIFLKIAAVAVLPFAIAQSASAHDYYESDYRLEHNIEQDRAAIRHDYVQRHYYAERQREASMHGHFFEALHYAWRKRHEDHEISRRQSDLRHDYNAYDRHY